MIISKGVNIKGGVIFIAPPPPLAATLIYDLDAANYSAVPTNGSLDATGNYAITVANAGSTITWSSTANGVFAKSNSTGTDYIAGGPNYQSSSQSYTVFTAYKVNTVSLGRLLNTTNESPNDWAAGTHNGYENVFYPGASVRLDVDPITSDTGWHLQWMTLSAGSGVGNLYVSNATNGMPSTTYATASLGAGGNYGFNQIRMFSRTSGSEVQTGNVAFIKVYNGVLSLGDIQSLWSSYHSRFGL